MAVIMASKSRPGKPTRLGYYVGPAAAGLTPQQIIPNGRAAPCRRPAEHRRAHERSARRVRVA